MNSPEQLPVITGLPELMRFENGNPVNTPDDWALRRKELLALYSEYLYGWMPDRSGEKLAWSLKDDPETGGTLLCVSVSAGGRNASFSVLVGLPAAETAACRVPVFIEYWPWHYQNWVTKEWVTGFSANCRYAMRRGYAAVQYDCSQIAQDNDSRTGAFYSLYPYDPSDPVAGRGTLLAWAWGVSKIIDALEAGAGARLGIDPALSLVGGVSRYGKSAAVAGAYDERIRVTVPSCSGAGGTAVFRTCNHGKTYNLSSLGGPEQWVNDSQNEPFSILQGGEGYWFCSQFARIPSARHLPVDQHMLCALAAAPDRHLIIVTGITSEGWNNTEGQCLAFAASQPVWDLLGCGGGNNMIIHLDGHAILPSDLRIMLDYCDIHLLGKSPENPSCGPDVMKGSLFLRDNRNILDPLFAPYLSNQLPVDR